MDSSLRSRRLSTVGELGSSSGGGPPPAASSSSSSSANRSHYTPFSSSNHPNRPPLPTFSSSSSSIPPGLSTGGGAGGTRPQSNVGAKLLKKRQSVSYHHQNHIYAVGAGVIPPLPPTNNNFPHQLNNNQVLPQQGRLQPVPERRDDQPGKIGATSSSAVNGGTNGGGGGGGAAAVGLDNETIERLGNTGLDIKHLAEENFKPEEFLKSNWNGTDSQMQELKHLRTQLEGAMKITETELQKSVFKNYADFVIISKEIATLENEMLDLKSVLEEWRAVPESLEGGWGEDDLLIGSSGPNRRTQRNSLADLATLYKSQLAALWEGVEGSQKLLPFIPGRHIITETTSFVELNSATYKPKQSVHLFLLNDALLVSVKKRRGTGVGGPTRLVAERCFNLSEIVVVDLKDGGDLTNAVKIKRGKETVIFRTDKAEDKKILLMAFKKVAEELMNKKRKEMLSEAEARKGDFSSALRGGARPGFDGGLTSNGFSPAQALGLGSGDSTGKDLAWIGDFSDELSVSIAARMFEEATTFIEKGKAVLPQLAGDPHASAFFRTKLDARTSELLNALLHDLSDPSIRKSGVVRTTAWLLRLNQGERARETFLTARGLLVRKRARQIKFEGDISMYISELAMVTFTMIKNTCEWYMAAFKDNRMASGFVRWASEQVEIYAETFRRQVYGADQDRKVIQESLEVTKAHGAMLRDVGLDFTFLLDGRLRSDEVMTSATGAKMEPLRPGPRRKPSNSKQSHVAMARQSVFMMHNNNNGALASPTREIGSAPATVPE